MARKIRFPLKMADGAAVRDPEELKEHFDLASVLGYYDDGRLAVWLENCYYDNEARQVRELELSDPEFKRKLCEILGIQSVDVAEMDNPFNSLSSMVKVVSISDVRENNRRLKELRKYTDDDEILAAIDSVAFTQEDLERLLAEKVHKIYLCGERFTVPSGAADWLCLEYQYMTVPVPKFLYITFIGVNHPTVDITEAEEWIDPSIRGGDGLAYMNFEDVKLTARASFLLAEVLHDSEKAFPLYQDAAEKGLAEAQRKLGYFYYKGYATEKNYELAVKWYQMAADGGDLDAQNMVGIFYGVGIYVPQNYETAVKWYRKAAEQGYGWAQYNLGRCYQKGQGVERDEKEAVKWLQRAADNGVSRAQQKLLELDPRQFKLSEVVLCAAGGKENIDSAQLDTSTYTIGIAAKDRKKVNEAILKKYGAIEIQIEPIYYKRTEKKISPKKALGVAARAYFGLWAYDIGKAALEGKPLLNGKPLLDVWTNEAVNEDLGWGFLCFRLKTITAEMLEDFNRNVKKDPDAP